VFKRNSQFEGIDCRADRRVISFGAIGVDRNVLSNERGGEFTELLNN